jgi:hypothetical protein
MFVLHRATVVALTTLCAVSLVSAQAMTRGKRWRLKEYLESRPAVVFTTYDRTSAKPFELGEPYDFVKQDVTQRLGQKFGVAFKEAKLDKDKKLWVNAETGTAVDQPYLVMYGVSGSYSITDEIGGTGKKVHKAQIEVTMQLRPNAYATTEFPWYETVALYKQEQKKADASPIAEFTTSAMLEAFKAEYSRSMDALLASLDPPAEVKVTSVTNPKKKLVQIAAGSKSGYDRRASFYAVKEVAGDDPATPWEEEKHLVAVAEIEIKTLGEESSEARADIADGVNLEDLAAMKVIYQNEAYKGRWKL